MPAPASSSRIRAGSPAARSPGSRPAFALSGPEELSALAGEAPAGRRWRRLPAGALRRHGAGMESPMPAAAFYGLSAAHGTAHMARALLEGWPSPCATWSSGSRSLGVATGEDPAAGRRGAEAVSGRRSAPTCCSARAELSSLADSSPLGAGLLAAVAAGGLPNLDEAAAAIAPETRRIEPNAGSSARPMTTPMAAIAGCSNPCAPCMPNRLRLRSKDKHEPGTARPAARRNPARSRWRGHAFGAGATVSSSRARLAGREAELVRGLGLGHKLAVVSDPADAPGPGRARRTRRCRRAGPIEADRAAAKRPTADDGNRGDDPRPDEGRRPALIAVGSGTINDLCKYAAFLDAQALCRVRHRALDERLYLRQRRHHRAWPQEIPAGPSRRWACSSISRCWPRHRRA